MSFGFVLITFSSLYILGIFPPWAVISMGWGFWSLHCRASATHFFLVGLTFIGVAFPWLEFAWAGTLHLVYGNGVFGRNVVYEIVKKQK